MFAQRFIIMFIWSLSIVANFVGLISAVLTAWLHRDNVYIAAIPNGILISVMFALAIASVVELKDD